MGDTLFGRERSGTPVETRQQSGEMADFFSQLMRSQVGGAPVLGRQGIDAAADITAGFRAGMEPFNERETARQTAGLREMFGTMGGRFGTPLMREESNLRENMGAQFQQQELAAMLQALAPVLQAEQARLGTAAAFLQPGAPIWQEGVAGDLLTAGGTAAGLAFPPAAPAMAASNFIPAQRPQFNAPSFFPGAPGLRR